MAGIGETCKEVDGCGGGTQRNNSVQVNGPVIHVPSISRGRVDNQAEASYCTGGVEYKNDRPFKVKNKTTADFYCPLADSLEWIDGPESPNTSPTTEIWGQSEQLPNVNTEAPRASSSSSSNEARHSGPSALSVKSTNGWKSNNAHRKPTKHSRSDIMSILSCALPHREVKSLPENSCEELSEVKVGNSKFYVPSVLCFNNNIAFAELSENAHKNSHKADKTFKHKEPWKLPNGLSFGKRINNSAKKLGSGSRKSWPNSDSSSESHHLKSTKPSVVSNSAATGPRTCEDQSAKQLVTRSLSANCVQAVKCPEAECIHPAENKCTLQTLGDGHCSSIDSSPDNDVDDNLKVVVQTSCERIEQNGTPSRSAVNGLNISACPSVIRDSSTESNDTVEFYDDGVFLEDRSPLEDIVENFQSYTVCADSDSDIEADRHSNTCSERLCDTEHSNSSYNFLEASVSATGYYKYCEKSKDLDTVFLDSACSNSCDNNDDIGDFIETDIPLTAERSSLSGSQVSTSSNDEDNVLSCQDLEKVNKENINISCWDHSERDSVGVNNPSANVNHHPQESDMSRDGVFFSYAPNHNPSLIPGIFRRETRNCLGRLPGGSSDRRQNDLLSEQSGPRHFSRPRGRSDSSSIAKQSSSDSEISNLAYSDSSALISPELDMAGMELLVSSTEVDRALTSNTGACNNVENDFDASSVTLMRNSSEEGFHESPDEDFGPCLVSGAHASGNCCCPNDLSGSSHVPVTTKSNLSSPSAAADSRGLNLHVQFPQSLYSNDVNHCCSHENREEGCVLTSDLPETQKFKGRTRQRYEHGTRNIGSAVCRDNRCDRNPNATQTMVNNIIGEEECCHSSKTAHTTRRSHQRLRLSSLPGASTDPLLQDGVHEASQGDFPLTNRATDSLLQNGRASRSQSDVQKILLVMLEQKRKQIHRKFGGAVEKACMPQQERVMIWSEYEAFVLQEKPVLSGPCGVMAVCNMLKALRYEVPKEEIMRTVNARPRDQDAPIPEYLFSRSVAGATAAGLIRDVTELTKGAVTGRFFRFHPPREVHLLSWLANWIHKGAVPIATLNLQKTSNGNTIPDAWHHQMIYGVSAQGVHMTNPTEVVEEKVVMRQLCSDSVLLVRRKDILSRLDDRCQLQKFLEQTDDRWQTLNVLGQVVNVLREETVARVTGYRAQVTSHVTIPAAYFSGIAVYMKSESPHCHELLAAPELPPSSPDSQASHTHCNNDTLQHYKNSDVGIALSHCRHTR